VAILNFSATFSIACAFIMVMIVDAERLRRATSVDNESKEASDGQLIARARSDPAAFVQLYRRYYDAIFHYCAHRLFERTAAEDVTSQVFLKAVENFGRFNGNGQQFRNWLYRIATNAVNNHLRKTARRDSLLKTAREQANSQAVDCGDSSERLALLREAVLALKPRYQTIITLRFFENLKLTEIAEVLGSSPGTVRSQLARALAKLRKVLATEFTEKSKVIENE
jgi:RNA polymerase sigma-70 factor (ECF subfamily)